MLPRTAVEGRLAAEPELRFSPSGVAVARLRIVASDRRRNENSGEWEDGDTLWLDVTVFKAMAENVCESLVKGDLVIATGKLRTEEWTDRDSQAKRSKITMIADSVGPSLQFRQTPHGSKQRGSIPQQEHTPSSPAIDSEPPF